MTNIKRRINKWIQHKLAWIPFSKNTNIDTEALYKLRAFTKRNNKSNLDPTIPVGQSDQSTNISTPVFTDGQAPTGVEFPDSYKDDQHKKSMMNIKGKKKGDVGKNDDDSNLIYSEPNLQSTG
ncbi:12470_t:CDS:2 [Entrophospora sp. SA101]|nr:12470_t:CDS:2 [Entrophospora sp. SA101]